VFAITRLNWVGALLPGAETGVAVGCANTDRWWKFEIVEDKTLFVRWVPRNTTGRQK